MCGLLRFADVSVTLIIHVIEPVFFFGGTGEGMVNIFVAGNFPSFCIFLYEIF